MNPDLILKNPIIATATTNVTVGNPDVLTKLDATAGSFTVTLSGVKSGSRFQLRRTDATSNSITLVPSSGKINGRSSIIIYSFNQTISIVWDGTNYALSVTAGEVQKPNFTALERLSKKNKGKAIKIVLSGDSTTDEAANPTYDGLMRKYFIDSIDGVFPGATLYNGGANGELLNTLVQTTSLTSGDSGWKFALSRIAYEAPDLIVFSWGINDVRNEYTTAGLTLAAFEVNLRFAINWLLEFCPNAVIIARMPNPIFCKDGSTTNLIIPLTNQKAHDASLILAQAYENLEFYHPRVILSHTWEEVYPTINNDRSTLTNFNFANTTLNSDELHPKDSTYPLIAKSLFKLSGHSTLPNYRKITFPADILINSVYVAAFHAVSATTGGLNIDKSQTSVFPDTPRYEALRHTIASKGDDLLQLTAAGKTLKLNAYFPDTDEILTGISWGAVTDGVYTWNLSGGSLIGNNYASKISKSGIVVFFIKSADLEAHPLFSNSAYSKIYVVDSGNYFDIPANYSLPSKIYFTNIFAGNLGTVSVGTTSGGSDLGTTALDSYSFYKGEINLSRTLVSKAPLTTIERIYLSNTGTLSVKFYIEVKKSFI